MVLKMFEPLRFDCIKIIYSRHFSIESSVEINIFSGRPVSAKLQKLKSTSYTVIKISMCLSVLFERGMYTATTFSL